MEKIFMRIFVLVFGLVGVGLLTGAFFALKSEMSFRADSVTAEGTVVDLAPTTDSDGKVLHKPVVDFIDRNDQRHRITGTTASSPPSYRIGEAVTVRYRPAEPTDAHLDSFMDSWLLVVILGGIGLVFTAFAAGFLTYAIRRRRIRAWLATNGIRLQLPIERVYIDTSMKIRGRSPYRISAQWHNPTTQKVHVFSSDPIWFDPSPYVQQKKLDVSVNAENPRQYVVDTSFLPEAG